MLRALGVIFEKRDRFIKRRNQLGVKKLQTLTQLRRDELEMWRLKRELADLG